MTQQHSIQNGQDEALAEQLAAAYPPQAPARQAANAFEGLPPDVAMQALTEDPVGFIRQVVDTAAGRHLHSMKEEAELHGALTAFRKSHPDARQFEPFILQEVSELIRNDDDGHIEPWDKLLEKGLDAFRRKFKAALKQDPALLERQGGSAGEGLQLEGRSNRKLPQASPAFTRDQIAKMSLAEFVAREADINDAMTNKRIR